MKASVITAFGGPEVLQVRDWVEPVPGPGQVAIRVAYAGVNFAETMARRGGYHSDPPPFVPGLEVSGHIFALGEGVENLRVGQPVAAFIGAGGYAEIALAQAVFTFPLDQASAPIALASAAAFPTIVPTAYDMLTRVARLQAGETVLVHAAAGGVGSIAGQVARLLGAGRVIGTVSTLAKADYARASGFDEVILRENFVEQIRELTSGRGVDIVLEAIGEPVRSQSLDLLAPFGRLVIFGNASDEQGRLHSLPLNAERTLFNRAIMGYTIGGLSVEAPQLLAETARITLDLVARQQIRLDISEILPLEQAGEAHRRLEGGSTTGKLLLKIG